MSADRENTQGQILKFRAAIEDAGNGGAFVMVPFDVERVFGKKRVKVKAVIEGEAYSGSLVRMGTPCHILGVRKEIREKIGKTFGDEIEITIEEDIDPREVIIPSDLNDALKNAPEALAFFRELSFTNQKAYVQWIEDARRDPSRKCRIEQTVQLLKERKKK